MGKRRSNLNHKDRYQEDDESEEEIIEETPLDEDQKAAIQSRKKLVAKRKGGAGIESSLSTSTPFSLFSKSSTDEKTGPPVFSGFKGFTAFKPGPLTTTVESTISTETSNSAASKFSFDKKDSSELKTQSSILNGSKPELEIISSKPASQIVSEAQSDKTKLPKNKSISETELKFITELNDLYARCYGSNKRSYKLPIEVLEECGENSDQETKYACLLAELNRHISKWISKHVEESPMVLLTPVFVDYFNYLILLEKHFFPGSFKKHEKISDSADKLTNGTKIPLNGTNGVKDSAEKSEIIIEDKAKENQDSVDSNKKISFKSASLPFTPISLDTNTKESFKFGSIASSEEGKSSFFKKSTTTEIKEVEQTPSLSSQITLPRITTNFETSEKSAQDQKTETSQSKTLFASFSGNVQSSNSLFKFNSNIGTVNENNEAKNEENNEKNEEKKAEGESKKFSFTPTAGGFFSSLKKNDNESIEKKEEKKSDEESQKFSFGQTPGGIFSSLKKSEEKQDELKEKSSDNSSFKPLTNTPFSFSSIPSSETPKSIFSFGSSDKSAIFSSIAQAGDSKSIFGSSSTSFGSGITFPSTAPAAGGDADGEEEPYEPPKPESSNVKEEGSVYEKRMKLYYFSEKEEKFVDRGIGNLFIKPTKDGESTQLIIRADTTLANILLNVKLSKLFPISKIGPKDVSYLCVPNPEIPGVSNSIPCKFLFKVKTPEDADELLEKLNEYKK